MRCKSTKGISYVLEVLAVNPLAGLVAIGKPPNRIFQRFASGPYCEGFTIGKMAWCKNVPLKSENIIPRTVDMAILFQVAVSLERWGALSSACQST